MKERNTFTDNKKYDLIKFYEMIFIKDRKWRDTASKGIEINSQYLKRCFGDDYKKRVIDFLISNGHLKVISDKYCYGENIKCFCKKYAITETTNDFYNSLKSIPSLNAKRSEKRFSNGLNRLFDDSLNFSEYSIKDNRIHSPWVTVPKEIRHNHIRSNGNKLVYDIDIKTAYPSMIMEYINNKPEFEGEDVNFKQLFNGDFYYNLINLLEVYCHRKEMKVLFNSFVNSNEDQIIKYRGKLLNLSKRFIDEFPIISSWIIDHNIGNEFLGGFLAKEFEKPIIKSLKDDLTSLLPSYLHCSGFNDIEIIIIFDGLEIWGSEYSDDIYSMICNSIQKIEKNYDFIKMVME